MVHKTKDGNFEDFLFLLDSSSNLPPDSQLQSKHRGVAAYRQEISGNKRMLVFFSFINFIDTCQESIQIVDFFEPSGMKE